MMKRILVSAILLAVILLGGSGCMQNNPTLNHSSQDGSAQNINSVALEYMEKKYGEKFEYVAPYGNSMTGTHQLLVKCDSMPEQSILVRIENYKREDKVFLDNYLAVKYRDDTLGFISDCASHVFGEASVFYDVAMQALSPDLSADTSFDEYLADTRVPLQIMVEVKSSKFVSKNHAQQFAERIATHGSDYYLSLVFVSDSNYGAVDSKALEEQMASGNYVHCAKMTRLDGEIEVRWLEE